MQSITITINDLKEKSTPEIQVEAFDMQYKKLEEEFEETIRGELLNLKSIKKHLETVIHNKEDYHSADFNYALRFVSSDVSNLEKFVDERWGK